MNDDQLREIFGEMREDAIPAESLARVRMAVAERVEARRRRVGFGWKVTAALVACGCVGAVMWSVRTVAPAPEHAAPPVVVVEQAAPVETPLPPKPVLRKVVHKKVQPAPVEGGASEIRIESPLEPDVVIVLIGG